MREKLIELLAKTPDIGWSPSAREAVADHLIANGVTIQKWIPASEPPKEDGKYFVYQNFFGKLTSIDVFYYAHDGEKVDEYDLKGEKNIWYTYDSEYGYYTVDSVTHWMPLPEEPKEEI